MTATHLPTYVLRLPDGRYAYGLVEQRENERDILIEMGAADTYEQACAAVGSSPVTRMSPPPVRDA